MSLDTRIPLSVKPVNFTQSLQEGISTRNALDERRKRNKLAELYETQGAGLVSGSPEAVNALARLDPAQAAGYQDRAMAMQAAERKAALQKAGMVAGAVYGADTPEKFEAAKVALRDAGILSDEDMGAYSFDGRAALIAQVQGVEGQIKQEQDLRDFAEGKRRFGAQMAQRASQFAQSQALQRQRMAMQQANADRQFNYRREQDARASAMQPGPKAPSGFTYQEDGTLAPIPGGPADPAYKQQTRGNGITQTLPDGTVIQIGGQPRLNEGQAKDVGFAQRMNLAETQMQDVLGDGYDPTTLNSFGDKVFSRRELTNWLASEDGQAFQNAAEQFLVAVLRKDTGAAVTPEEWKRYSPIFIPTVGDNDRVLEQKRQMREVAIDATSRNVPLADVVARIRGDTTARTSGGAGSIQELSDEDLMRMLNQ